MRSLYTIFSFLLLILIGCGQQPYQPPYARNPVDPCAPAYYQEYACQMALNQGGYYHFGSFYPYGVGYNRTIVVYRDRYNGWISQGNRPTVIDFRAPEYSRSYRSTGSSTTSSGSYRSEPSQPSINTPIPATGSYRSEPANRVSPSGSYREPQPRDPITGRFVKKESAPPSTSYRSDPTPSSSPSSGSYRSSAAPSSATSGSYRSTPSQSTSLSSTRSTSSGGYSSGGSSRSSSSSSSSRSSSSSSSSSSGSSRSSSSRR